MKPKKQVAGEKAVEFVKSDMTIGLGSGSTVFFAIKKLGEMITGGLNISAVPTSLATEALMAEYGVPAVPLRSGMDLDLAIDGADEIDPHLNLIKGGGGSLFREKMVAFSAKRFIVAADNSKSVAVLGKFHVPVEVLPFGWEATADRIRSLSITPVLRRREGNEFITDNGGLILDCDCGEIADPADLHRKLKLVTGVVETGLFFDLPVTAVIAGETGISILNR